MARARSQLSPSLWESQLGALQKYPFPPWDGFRPSPGCQERAGTHQAAEQPGWVIDGPQLEMQNGVN